MTSLNIASYFVNQSAIVWDFRPSWVRVISNGGRIVPGYDGTGSNGTFEFPATYEKKESGLVELQGRGTAQFLKFCKSLESPQTCILNSIFRDPLVEYDHDGTSFLTVTVLYGLSTGPPGNQEGPFTYRLAYLDFSGATSAELNNTVHLSNIGIQLMEEHRIVFDNAYPANDTLGTLNLVYPAKSQNNERATTSGGDGGSAISSKDESSAITTSEGITSSSGEEKQDKTSNHCGSPGGENLYIRGVALSAILALLT